MTATQARVLAKYEIRTPMNAIRNGGFTSGYIVVCFNGILKLSFSSETLLSLMNDILIFRKSRPDAQI
jgi:hypothetical protein